MNTSFEYPIVFFDGVCNLCNRAVQFLIRHDARKKLRFAPLQGETAKRLLANAETIHTTKLDSFVLLEGDRLSTRSTAALRACRYLGWFWRLGYYGGMIFPRFIRDGVYNFIARRRYRWFGRKESCMIPTPELRERFLP